MSNFYDQPNDDEELISKSDLKREAQALQDFAARLTDLSKKEFNSLPLEDTLREALTLARRLDSPNAKKRQFRYISKLLQKMDRSEIDAALEKQHQNSQQVHSRKADVESWCDTLLQGDDAFLNQLVEKNPAIDRTHLRQLVRQANKDAKAKNKPPSNHKLFKYLLKQLFS